MFQEADLEVGMHPRLRLHFAGILMSLRPLEKRIEDSTPV
jgi:hypothetical protein